MTIPVFIRAVRSWLIKAMAVARSEQAALTVGRATGDAPLQANFPLILTLSVPADPVPVMTIGTVIAPPGSPDTNWKEPKAPPVDPHEQIYPISLLPL